MHHIPWDLYALKQVQVTVPCQHIDELLQKVVSRAIEIQIEMWKLEHDTILVHMSFSCI